MVVAAGVRTSLVVLEQHVHGYGPRQPGLQINEIHNQLSLHRRRTGSRHPGGRLAENARRGLSIDRRLSLNDSSPRADEDANGEGEATE